MSALQSEVDVLREQLAAKEAIIAEQKRLAKEKEEQSWEFNLDFIQRDTGVVAAHSEVSGVCEVSWVARCGRNQARQRAPFMQAVLNCLQRLDEKLSEYDKRLAHIERFGMMDYGKEKDIPENENLIDEID